MSNLLKTSVLAIAGLTAGCSTIKQTKEPTAPIETPAVITDAQVQITKTQKAIADVTTVADQEIINMNISRSNLSKLMELLDEKKFSQIENSSSYIIDIQKLLNEVKKLGIVDFGDDLELDSILSEEVTKAIKAFQTAFNKFLPAGHRISEDGLIGSQTIGALITASSDYIKSETPENTLENFLIASHNKEYIEQRKREWAAKDKIDEKNRKFFESLDKEKIETYTRQILNLTPQSGPIVLPDTMNSAEAGMALWDVWSSTENEQSFNNLKRESFDLIKISTCTRLPKIILSKELKEIIENQIIPNLQSLFAWENAEGSPNNFLKSLQTK